MRYRVRDYRVEASESIVWLYFQAPDGVTLTSDPDNEIEGYIQQAIRLVADESEDIVFCSSMQKRKYIQWAKSNVSTREVRLAFEIPSGKMVGDNDQFTIEMDWGDVPSGLGGGGGELEPATDAEYAAFKSHMATEIDNIITTLTEA